MYKRCYAVIDAQSGKPQSRLKNPTEGNAVRRCKYLSKAIQGASFAVSTAYTWKRRRCAR